MIIWTLLKKWLRKLFCKEETKEEEPMLSNAIMGAGGNDLPEFTFANAKYDAAKSADLGGVIDRAPFGWSMSADGTKGYTHNRRDEVSQVNFSTPFDATTATRGGMYAEDNSVGDTFDRMRGFSMNAGGDHALILGMINFTSLEPNVYTTTNGNLLGMANMQNGPDSSSVDAVDEILGCCYLSADGSFYLVGTGQLTAGGLGQIIRVNMPTPYNRQTSVVTSITTFSETGSEVKDMTFSPDGLMMGLIGYPSVANYSRAFRYVLTTPFDPATATLVESYVFPELNQQEMKGIHFRADMKGFSIAFARGNLHVYDL